MPAQLVAVATGEDEAFAQLREDIIVRFSACVPVNSLRVTCQNMLHWTVACSCSLRRSAHNIQARETHCS
jgi:hypothetical protein